MIYDYWQRADNPEIRIDAKYDSGNVKIQDKQMRLQQLGFTAADQQAGGHVSMAGLQSRRLDIIHGTFRTTFKVEGANGGSCASFFWYRDNSSELDIEAVTKGTSLVNNTINYTTQPSMNADGSHIPNATLSVPLADEFNTNIEIFHEHRFDCDREGGAKFYLDGKLMQVDAHNIPRFAGNLQLKLWADGNKWWSGHPSLTTVTMSVKSVIAYFNTTGTEDGSDQQWFKTCAQAGGPSDNTICQAYAEVGKVDDLPIAASGVAPKQAPMTQSVTVTGAYGPASSQTPMTGPQICVMDPTGPHCPPHKNQAARFSPYITISNYLTGFAAKPKVRSTSESDPPSGLKANGAATQQGPACWRVGYHLTKCADKSRATRRFRLPIAWMVPGLVQHWRSQPTRDRPWIRSSVPGKPDKRHEPSYQPPFGSTMEGTNGLTKENATRTSRGTRMRPPQPFSFRYADNSTDVQYKLGRRQPRSNLKPASAPTQSATGGEDQVMTSGNCQKGKVQHCSFGSIGDLGKWWSCLRETSDWCSSFSASSSMLTIGLIQVVSVPLIFAWVFYLTEM